MIDGIGRAPSPRAVVAAGDGAARAGSAAQTGRAGSVAGVGKAPEVTAAGASNLGRIASDLAASPPVDSAKVATLKAAIASGNYRPDPARIAERMMALETVPPKR